MSDRQLLRRSGWLLDRKKGVMKERLFILGFVMLVWATTANSQAPRPFLDKTVAGVNATNNVTVNVALDRGFFLSGTISAGTASAVVAVSTTGSFAATPFRNTYQIVLPAGTYSLNVTFKVSLTSFTYTDTPAFTVSGDTKHDITLPTVATSAVTGTISNLDPLFGNGVTVVFDSTTIPGFSDVTATFYGSNFNVPLPDGTYSVTLTESYAASVYCGRLCYTFISDLTTNPFDSVAVRGPTQKNFVAPTISSAVLSGQISLTGSPAIDSWFLAGTDVTGGTPPASVSSGSGELPTEGGFSGLYNFRFRTGRTYALTPSIFMHDAFFPGEFTYSPPDPSPASLNGDTTRNVTFPAPSAPPAPVTISGQVTVAGSGAPVPNAQVRTSGMGLIGAPNTSYFADYSNNNVTDGTGHYSIVVPSGTNYTLSFHAGPRATGDFDGDGKADVAVFRPSEGTWYVNPSSNLSTILAQRWGTSGDVPVRGDYDGDGRTDFAVFRPSVGTWYVIPSSAPSTVIAKRWGTSGDIPVPGDYDGDGKTDFAVFRPSNGYWYVIPSSAPSTVIAQHWGTSGDIPVPGDYDGDGKTDFAVFRPSNGFWYVIPSTNPTVPIARQWGTSGDIPVPEDYDGDDITDFAVFRPSDGTWYVILSSAPNTPLIQQLGTSGDVPVPADYDGDRIADFAVWQPSNGTWYVIPSTNPSALITTQFGTSTDVPVQKPPGQ